MQGSELDGGQVRVRHGRGESCPRAEESREHSMAPSHPGELTRESFPPFSHPRTPVGSSYTGSQQPGLGTFSLGPGWRGGLIQRHLQL